MPRIYERLPRITPATKSCSRCRKIKTSAEFHKDRSTPSGLTGQCRDCNNRINREVCKPRMRARLKEWLRSQKDVPCMDCGGSFPPECMDFDHVRGKKSFSLNTSRGGIAMERLLREREKCEVVCSNCHRIRTTQRDQHRTRKSA